MKYLIIPFLGFFLASCDLVFRKNFSKVQIGHTRQQVKQLLGDPDLKEEGTVPTRPFWGSLEAVGSNIGPGTPYKMWRYKKNKHVYDIFFATTTGKLKSQWVVVGESDYPEGAVF